MNATATFHVALANETATAQLMADLALLLSAGDVVTLSGDLGAGKTAAARALIRYLADDNDFEVPSPTFTLAQTYDLPAFPLIHADLYRIDTPDELEEIGLSPLPDGTVILIEWPERAPRLMPTDRIDIAFSHRPAFGSSARAVELAGHGRLAAQIDRLQALRRVLELSGLIDARRQRMPGDASTRSYARLFKSEQSFILMNAPRRPDGPALYDGKSYSAAVHLAEDVRPFVAIARGLRERGYSAPEIRYADLDTGFLITEDLGRATFVEGDPPTPIPERYEAAVDMLAALHHAPLPGVLPVAPHLDYSVPPFDDSAMLIEIGLMPEWYLPDKGVTLTESAKTDFTTIWRGLLTKIAGAPKTWVLRDFHSPNLIWLADRKDIARVGLLDFQDAVMGPAAYDVVSLLQDARIDIPESTEIPLLTRYVLARKKAESGFDPAAFAEQYAIMSAQRNTRLLGTFARLNRRDGKPQYLRHQPRVFSYLQRALAHPTLSAYRAWCEAHLPPPET